MKTATTTGKAILKKKTYGIPYIPPEVLRGESLQLLIASPLIPLCIVAEEVSRKL
ncbi:hypothetical protein G9A89_001814 [Geosiphon pyriformis]|nr:hypothetical protein G9A89_001814 [Geosiphon pyriformis]